MDENLHGVLRDNKVDNGFMVCWILRQVRQKEVGVTQSIHKMRLLETLHYQGGNMDLSICCGPINMVHKFTFTLNFRAHQLHYFIFHDKFLG